MHKIHVSFHRYRMINGYDETTRSNSGLLLDFIKTAEQNSQFQHVEYSCITVIENINKNEILLSIVTVQRSNNY